MAQKWRIICISQVSLSLLHSMHTAVDGPHQGLLGQTLTKMNNRNTHCKWLNKSNLNIQYVLSLDAKV